MKLVTKTAAYLVGRAAVKLHYRHHLNLYTLCSEHEPELYKKSQAKAAIPKGIRWTVWRRDNFTCLYCGNDQQQLTLDHVVPESHGGKAEVDNLITACIKCNTKKSSKSFEEFIHSPWLKKKIKHLPSLTMKVQKPQQSPQIKEMISQIANATGRRNCSSTTVSEESPGQSLIKQTYLDSSGNTTWDLFSK